MTRSIFDYIHAGNLSDLEIKDVDINCYGDVVSIKMQYKNYTNQIFKVKIAFFCKDENGWYTRFDIQEPSLTKITAQACNDLRAEMENLFGGIIESLVGECIQ